MSAAAQPRPSTSFWRDEIEREEGAAPSVNILLRPVSCDVLVIGGGFAGLSTALELKRRSPETSVVLVEAGRVGFGSSGRNAGMLVPLAGPLWLLDGSASEADQAWGMAELDRRMDQVGSEMGSLEGGPVASRWYLAAPSALATQAIIWMHERFAKFGLPSELIGARETEAQIGEAARLAIVRKGYQIHPARLARSMGTLARSQGIEIYEHTRVQRLEGAGDGMQAVTDTGIVCRARKVVSACGAWVKALRPEVGGKLWETWMLATAPLPEETLRRLGGSSTLVVGAKPDLMYRRVYGGRLLLGGFDDGTAHPSPTGFIPENVVPRLHRLIRESLPWLGPVPIDYVWGGPMHVYWDQKPRIQVDAVDQRIVLVAGMSGSGVIWALMAGSLAAGLIDPMLDTADDKRLRQALAGTRIPPWGLAKAGMGFVAGALFGRWPKGVARG